MDKAAGLNRVALLLAPIISTMAWWAISMAQVFADMLQGFEGTPSSFVSMLLSYGFLQLSLAPIQFAIGAIPAISGAALGQTLKRSP
jgi:hypothetical protein